MKWLKIKMLEPNVFGCLPSSGLKMMTVRTYIYILCNLPCLPQDYKDEIEVSELVEFCNKRLTKFFVFTAKRELDENFVLFYSIFIFITFLL